MLSSAQVVAYERDNISVTFFKLGIYVQNALVTETSLKVSLGLATKDQRYRKSRYSSYQDLKLVYNTPCCDTPLISKNCM